MSNTTRKFSCKSVATNKFIFWTNRGVRHRRVKVRAQRGHAGGGERRSRLRKAPVIKIYNKCTEWSVIATVLRFAEQCCAGVLSASCAAFFYVNYWIFSPLFFLCACKRVERADSAGKGQCSTWPQFDRGLRYLNARKKTKGLRLRCWFAASEMPLVPHTEVRLTALPRGQRSGATLLWSYSRGSKW